MTKTSIIFYAVILVSALFVACEPEKPSLFEVVQKDKSNITFLNKLSPTKERLITEDLMGLLVL